MTYYLGRLALVTGALFLLVLGFSLFSSEDSPGREWLAAYETKLNQKLRLLRSGVTARHIVVAQALVSLLCALAALFLSNWALLLALPLVFFLPTVQLGRRVADRTTRFDEQIEAWLGAVANSLRASPSLAEAIASTIPLVPAPMSEEIDVLVKENELGTPLDRALDNLAERINTKTLKATVLALKVARKSGGNLPEMLSSAAAALRELARLEGVVRTKTAEGRAQAWVIAAIPVPMVAGLHAMDPKFFQPLFETFSGHFVMVIAGILWLVAILAAMKILAVDV